MDYIKINKYSTIPLYSQLKNSIKTAIKQGVLKSGDRVPTEKEICEKFNLSRTVTRQAFYELMNEGYIIRFKSKGTFVNKNNQRTSFLEKIMSFNDEMRLMGFTPKTELISIEETISNEYIAEKMEIPVGEPLIRIQRIRYRDDVPVVYVDAYFKAHLIKGIELYDLENNSLYDTLEEHFGIKVMHTHKQIQAKIVDDVHAEYLQVNRKSAVQYVESLDYNQENQLISYDLSVYVGDRNIFEVDINDFNEKG